VTLAGAFHIELTFGGGQPVRAHYNFDAVTGDVDLKHLIALDAAEAGLVDLMRGTTLGEHALAELKQQIAYLHPKEQP
jgi:hypothetical protein